MKRWMFALAAMGAFLTAGVAVAEHGDGRMRHGMMKGCVTA
jgi:hypothetical protein